MKKWPLILFIAATGNLFAQKAMSCYLEIGGASTFSSFNMDIRSKSGQHRGFGYKVGFGMGIDATYSYSYYDEYGTYHDDSSFLTIPFGVNYILGKLGSNSTFEVGVGGTILAKSVKIYSVRGERRGLYSCDSAGPDNIPAGNLIGCMSIMYRRQPLDVGFMWKVGMNVIIGTGGDLIPVPSIAGGFSW